MKWMLNGLVGSIFLLLALMSLGLCLDTGSHWFGLSMTLFTFAAVDFIRKP